jgi:hypothetical protein
MDGGNRFLFGHFLPPKIQRTKNLDLVQNDASSTLNMLTLFRTNVNFSVISWSGGQPLVRFGGVESPWHPLLTLMFALMNVLTRIVYYLTHSHQLQVLTKSLSVGFVKSLCSSHHVVLKVILGANHVLKLGSSQVKHVLLIDQFSLYKLWDEIALLKM